MLEEYKFKCLELDVPGGQPLHVQTRLALRACIDYECRVTFVHNDRTFRVEFEDLLNDVAEVLKKKVC